MGAEQSTCPKCGHLRKQDETTEHTHCPSCRLLDDLFDDDDDVVRQPVYQYDLHATGSTSNA
jgi:ssDNA-binding Zn-finger/Zn-ribbon topoisomerase 1